MAPEGLKDDDAFILIRRPGHYEMSQKQHSNPIYDLHQWAPSMSPLYEIPDNKTMGSM